MHPFPFEYLAIPVLLWVAVRQKPSLLTAALSALAAAAIGATVFGVGPFVRPIPIDSVLPLTVYLAAMTLMSVAVQRLSRDGRRAHTQLEEMSATDPLTGLGNHKRLLESLRAEIARTDRTSRSFAILVVDVDALKQINDAHGFLSGSRALIRTAEAVRQSCRVSDLAARCGGDEFAVILTETDRAGAEHLLRRISDRLRASDEKPAVSVSGGIASYPADGGTPGKLLAVARDLTARRAPPPAG